MPAGGLVGPWAPQTPRFGRAFQAGGQSPAGLKRPAGLARLKRDAADFMICAQPSDGSTTPTETVKPPVG